MEKFKIWLSQQKNTAKTAWTVVVIIVGLLGYQITLSPMSTTPTNNTMQLILERLDKIDKILTEQLDGKTKAQSIPPKKNGASLYIFESCSQKNSSYTLPEPKIP